MTETRLPHGDPAISAREDLFRHVNGAWLRDAVIPADRPGFGSFVLLRDAAESETLAAQVDDSAGVYIVPAFSGLFAPRWRADARGIIVGLTSYITKGHLARAVLEATGWQTREVVDAMDAEGIARPAIGAQAEPPHLAGAGNLLAGDQQRVCAQLDHADLVRRALLLERGMPRQRENQ